MAVGLSEDIRRADGQTADSFCRFAVEYLDLNLDLALSCAAADRLS